VIEKRPFERLGRFDNDWLSARYHFSFSDYFDPERRGVGPLIVWNDDTIKAGTGFPTHPHRDMEIITYIRSGAITHQDSTGGHGRTEAGNVQVMSAGTGVFHSEFNVEKDDMTLFQIWIRPDRSGHAPRYESRAFPRAPGQLIALASGRAEHPEALPIHQDAAVLGALLQAGQSLSHPLAGRQAYLVGLRGPISVNGVRLEPRDGAVIVEETEIRIEALADAEVVLADLPV